MQGRKRLHVPPELAGVVSETSHRKVPGSFALHHHPVMLFIVSDDAVGIEATRPRLDEQCIGSGTLL